MRKALTTGTVIQLDCGGALREFQIDRVIGTGASCIAYDAHCLDNASGAYLCRIKECYPFHAKIVRENNLLIWEDIGERDTAFARMQKTHSVLVSLRNSSEVGNSITTAFLCEGNGTLYSVMEVNHAHTFDREEAIDLYTLLETMRVLTQVVGKLHKKGYLHLDIKPENFLVTHDPSTSIWLFDVDSLTELSALHKGTVRSISYSPEWAAPEQIRGLTGKLCAATDLYAIGAILFHRIMGRFPVNEDMGLFADWSFDLPLLKKQNPRLCSYLREIFRKTLAASVKRRYQDASELAEKLSEASLLVKAKKPFLLSNCPAETTALLGRQRNLLEIQQTFQSDHRFVFLHGEGGIGKSTLAVSYGNMHKTEYDAVVFMRYRDSFQKSLSVLQLCNYEKEQSETKIELIKALLDDRTLVILDNYDVATDEAEDLEEILSCGADFIITTRTDFCNLLPSSAKQFEVCHLADQALTQLILSPSNVKPNETQKSSIALLLSMIGRNTYAAELLGRQMLDAGWPLDTLIVQISSGLERMGSAPKIRAMKDGKIQKRTFPDWLRVLFKIADLDERAQQILRNLYLLRYIEIDRDAYRQLTYGSNQDIDAINDLIERGWICTDGQYFSLHPLVEALVKADLNPDMENCEAVFWRFSSLGRDCIPTRYGVCDEDEEEYPSWDPDLDTYTAQKNTDLLFAFFRGLDVNDKEQRQFIVKWLLEALSYGVDLPESADKLETSAVLQSLNRVCTRQKLSTRENYEIHLVLFSSCLLQYRFMVISKDSEAHNAHRDECLIKDYHQVVDAVHALPVTKQRKAELQIGKWFIRFVNSTSSVFLSDIPKEVVDHLYSTCPDLFYSDTISMICFKEHFGLALTAEQQKLDDYLSNTDKEARGNIEKPISTYQEESEHQYDITEIKHCYDESEDKLMFIQSFLNNDHLSSLARARIVRNLLQDSFYGLQEPSYYYAPTPENWYSREEWERLEALVQTEYDFLSQHLEDDIPNMQKGAEEPSIQECISQNSIDKLTINAALSKEEDVQEYFSLCLESIKESLENHLQEAWQQFFRWSRGLPWINLIEAENSLNNLGKTHFMMPFLLEYVAFIESETQKTENLAIDVLFLVYRTVVEDATRSSREPDLSEQERAKYSAIAAVYQKKLDDLTNTSIHPKKSDE